MLSRFDTVSSISESNKTEEPVDDHLPRHNALSRTVSEAMNDAYRHFSELSAVSHVPRRDPSISEIVAELDPYKDAYADDDVDEWPEDEPSSQLDATFFAQAAPSHNAAMIPVRMDSFSQPFRQPLRSTVSQILGPLPPVGSVLESAPPPDFSSYTAPLAPPMAPIAEAREHSQLYEDGEEADDVAEPLALSELVHLREDTPTPDARRRSSVAALHRARTLPVAMNIARSRALSQAFDRGSSTQNVGERSSAGPIRGPRHTRDKVYEVAYDKYSANASSRKHSTGK